MLAQLIIWVCVFEFSLNAWSAAKYGTAPWEAWPSNGKLRPSDVISNNSFYRLPAIPWTFQLRCLGDWKSAADLPWQKPWNPCNACSFEQPSFRLMIFFAFSTSACLFCALAYTMSKMGNQHRTNANAWLRWRFKITSVHLDDLLQIVHRVRKDLDLSAAWHHEEYKDAYLFMLHSSFGACVASQMLKSFPALSVCLLQPNSRTILTFLGQCLQTNPSLMLVVSGLVYWWPCALPSWICTQDLTFVTSSQPLATLRGTEMSTSISGRSRPPMDSCTLGSKLGQLGIPPTNSVVALAEEARCDHIGQLV